ncbi:hypothetical protein Hanom_Chr10g00950951 [Helianthus anomalus]
MSNFFKSESMWFYFYCHFSPKFKTPLFLTVATCLFVLLIRGILVICNYYNILLYLHKTQNFFINPECLHKILFIPITKSDLLFMNHTNQLQQPLIHQSKAKNSDSQSHKTTN